MIFYVCNLGANYFTIKLKVLHGLPTTKTFVSFLHTLFINSAYVLNRKIFFSNRSFLFIPGPLLLAPAIIIKSESLKASSLSLYTWISESWWKLQSNISLQIPSSFLWV